MSNLSKIFLLALFFPVFNIYAATASFPKGTPLFYQNGSVVNLVVCGDTYSFDVVGHSNQNVWVEIKKDGTTVFDGLFFVPMNDYTSRCNSEANDAGKYLVLVYESENGVKGKAVASSIFTVQPKDTADLFVFRSLAPGILTLKLPSYNKGADELFYFLRKYRPDMDQIVFVPTFSWLKTHNSTTYGINAGGPLRPSLVEGIGIDGLDTSYGVVANSRFYGGSFASELADFNKDRVYKMYVLVHETGHNWGVYIAGKDKLGAIDPLGIGNVHWGGFVNNSFSLMGYGSSRITDNKDGTFKIESIGDDKTVFNDFDLYAMGLLSPENVQSTFVVSPMPGMSNAQLLNEMSLSSYQGRSFKAQKSRDVTVNDVISIEGHRVPSYGFTKNNLTNNLRVTFIILQGVDGTTQELDSALANVKDAAALFPKEWSRATRGLSSATIFDPVPKPNLVVSSFAASLSESKSVEIVEDIFESQKHDHPNLTNTNSQTTITQPTQPTQPAQSLADKLNQILARLLILQTELLNLIRLRAEFLGR